MEHKNCIHLFDAEYGGAFFGNYGVSRNDYSQLRAYLNANKQRDNWHQPISLFNIRFYGVS